MVFFVVAAPMCSDDEESGAVTSQAEEARADGTSVDTAVDNAVDDAPSAPTSPPSGATGVDDASVSITSPADGADVDSPFDVVMAAEGFTVEPAGGVRVGAGHFHLMVDTACVAPGDVIPDDATHLRLGDGSSETALALVAGEHTLCLQAGDGRHAALGLTHEITITVRGGNPAGEVEDTVDLSPGIEQWEGTYLGDVTWDCGAQQATGLIDGTFEIEVDEAGTATLTGVNFITGSCAGPEGQLGTEITITGQRTADGFEFPADIWQISDPIIIQVTGASGTGGVTGPAASAISITLQFEVVCLSCSS